MKALKSLFLFFLILQTNILYSQTIEEITSASFTFNSDLSLSQWGKATLGSAGDNPNEMSNCNFILHIQNSKKGLIIPAGTVMRAIKVKSYNYYTTFYLENSNLFEKEAEILCHKPGSYLDINDAIAFLDESNVKMDYSTTPGTPNTPIESKKLINFDIPNQ